MSTARASAMLSGAVAVIMACGGDSTAPGEPRPPSSALPRVSAGTAFTCALNAAGAAYCWGSNVGGALGIGSENEAGRPTPQRVAGGHVFTTLTSGPAHVCGLEADSTAYCWGHGSGRGASTNEIVPAPVAGGLKFRAIAAGATHTCAITTGGAAYCWGSNSFGQLGLGFVSAQAFSSPQAVTGGLTYSTITAGSGYTCAVAGGGSPYCWGFNGSGQLGLGPGVGASGTPMPRAVIGDLRFTSLSATRSTTCGIVSEGARQGAAYCWGENVNGQLGNNTSANSSAPVEVLGGLTFAQLTTGFHTCSVTGAGAAYCWGSDTHGQLGTGAVAPECFVDQDGTPVSVGPCRRHPAPVATGHLFSEVTVGESSRHTCGATPDGRMFCWGRNDQGQLGDGTTNNSALPVPVPLP